MWGVTGGVGEWHGVAVLTGVEDPDPLRVREGGALLPLPCFGVAGAEVVDSVRSITQASPGWLRRGA